jgi:acyl-CoA thioester hydrolase
MPRDQFRSSHSIRVRWAEVDPQGVVFNANYLMYSDVAAVEYWRSIGQPYPSAFHALGVDTFVVKATLEFKAPALYDEAIDLLARVGRLGRTSLSMLIEICREDTLLVSGEIVYVIASTDDRTPTPIPEPIRQSILQYERTAPDQ